MPSDHHNPKGIPTDLLRSTVCVIVAAVRRGRLSKLTTASLPSAASSAAPHSSLPNGSGRSTRSWPKPREEPPQVPLGAQALSREAVPKAEAKEQVTKKGEKAATALGLKVASVTQGWVHAPPLKSSSQPELQVPHPRPKRQSNRCAKSSKQRLERQRLSQALLPQQFQMPQSVSWNNFTRPTPAASRQLQ